MHIMLRPRHEVLTVKFNNKYFEITLDGEAWVPNDLGEYMCQRGLVMKGDTKDPGPQWEMNGNTHGDLKPKFAQWVREVPKSDVDETTTPEAVAAILERKATK